MIGGNTIAQIQISTTTKSEIGAGAKSWDNIQQITGWLDLAGGEASYTSYNAKIQESTHVFVADYQELDASINAENSRLVVNNKVYDIVLIDDPMEMHKQLEIFLKYTGGQ